MKKFKNRWLVTLCVLILVVGTVGVVNAATIQNGQSFQQTIADWIANDPNPMPMNMNTNMNTDPSTSTTSNTTNNTQPAANTTQPAANTTQPAANTTQPAANTNGQNSQQPAAGGQQNSQTPAPTSQNDLYNQMLQACLQMGGQMMQNCPMLNGSNMTPEQMIKACLQMNGQMMNMSQQDLAAMQQACQQWYQPGQKGSPSGQTPAGNSNNNWGHKNGSGSKWSNMGHW
ncbi:MAG: 1,4-beta-xylanase [Firmicutes bacterium]|nr:1,4-beta-xylanase [Bacillota bacterium]MCL5781703.1 1,4-beta-xylanase [Bacillota bacterium]